MHPTMTSPSEGQQHANIPHNLRLDAMSVIENPLSTTSAPQITAEIFKSTEFADELSRNADTRSFRSFCLSVHSSYDVQHMQPLILHGYRIYGRLLTQSGHEYTMLIIYSHDALTSKFRNCSDVELLDFVIHNFLYLSERRLLQAKLRNIRILVTLLQNINAETTLGQNLMIQWDQKCRQYNNSIQDYLGKVQSEPFQKQGGGDTRERGGSGGGGQAPTSTQPSHILPPQQEMSGQQPMTPQNYPAYMSPTSAYYAGNNEVDSGGMSSAMATVVAMSARSRGGSDPHYLNSPDLPPYSQEYLPIKPPRSYPQMSDRRSYPMRTASGPILPSHRATASVGSGGATGGGPPSSQAIPSAAGGPNARPLGPHVFDGNDLHRYAGVPPALSHPRSQPSRTRRTQHAQLTHMTAMSGRRSPNLIPDRHHQLHQPPMLSRHTYGGRSEASYFTSHDDSAPLLQNRARKVDPADPHLEENFLRQHKKMLRRQGTFPAMQESPPPQQQQQQQHTSHHQHPFIPETTQHNYGPPQATTIPRDNTMAPTGGSPPSGRRRSGGGPPQGPYQGASPYAQHHHMLEHTNSGRIQNLHAGGNHQRPDTGRTRMVTAEELNMAAQADAMTQKARAAIERGMGPPMKKPVSVGLEISRTSVIKVATADDDQDLGATIDDAVIEKPAAEKTAAELPLSVDKTVATPLKEESDESSSSDEAEEIPQRNAQRSRRRKLVASDVLSAVQTETITALQHNTQFGSDIIEMQKNLKEFDDITRFIRLKSVADEANDDSASDANHQSSSSDTEELQVTSVGSVVFGEAGATDDKAETTAAKAKRPSLGTALAQWQSKYKEAAAIRKKIVAALERVKGKVEAEKFPTFDDEDDTPDRETDNKQTEESSEKFIYIPTIKESHRTAVVHYIKLPESKLKLASTQLEGLRLLHTLYHDFTQGGEHQDLFDQVYHTLSNHVGSETSPSPPLDYLRVPISPTYPLTPTNTPAVSRRGSDQISGTTASLIPSTDNKTAALTKQLDDITRDSTTNYATGAISGAQSVGSPTMNQSGKSVPVSPKGDDLSPSKSSPSPHHKKKHRRSASAAAYSRTSVVLSADFTSNVTRELQQKVNLDRILQRDEKAKQQYDKIASHLNDDPQMKQLFDTMVKQFINETTTISSSTAIHAAHLAVQKQEDELAEIQRKQPKKKRGSKDGSKSRPEEKEEDKKTADTSNSPQPGRPSPSPKGRHRRSYSMPAVPDMSRATTLPSDEIPPQLIDDIETLYEDSEIQGILIGATEWNFDVVALHSNTKVNENGLILLAYHFLKLYRFDQPNVVCKAGISGDKLISFMWKIQESYQHENPYHNHMHACDVMCNVNYYFTHCSIYTNTQNFTPFHHFVMLIAGAVHDVGHTGHNNDYHIRLKSGLALRYNDQAVLENHHVSFAFRVLTMEECNIFDDLDDALQQDSARKIIIRSILGTDMAQHHAHDTDLVQIAEFVQKHKDSSEEKEEEGSIFSDKQKLTLLASALHVADISNSCKPLPLCKEWANRVIEEFRRQGDDEKKRFGRILQKAEMFRRDFPLEKSQLGWNKFFMVPFIKKWIAVHPELHMLATNIESNIQYWTTFKEFTDMPLDSSSSSDTEEIPPPDATTDSQPPQPQLSSQTEEDKSQPAETQV